MMRVKKEVKGRHPEGAARSPLAEGIMRKEGRERRDWASMDDGQLLAFAVDLIASEKIGNRKGLSKGDPGLYKALSRRGLLDKVGLQLEKRGWSSMDDGQLLAFARDIIFKEGIGNRNGLSKGDSGLYHALRRRGLLDEVGFRLERKLRDWASMDDRGLLAFARDIICRERIGNRKGLRITDPGLNEVLRKRGLLDEVGLQLKRRDWASMDDGQLLAFARDIIFKEGIGNRSGLRKGDPGLYEVLRKRGLLDAVFSDIERSAREGAVRQVVKAMEEFG